MNEPGVYGKYVMKPHLNLFYSFTLTFSGSSGPYREGFKSDKHYKVNKTNTERKHLSTFVISFKYKRKKREILLI
jgi:hypothetical protein